MGLDGKRQEAGGSVSTALLKAREEASNWGYKSRREKDFLMEVDDGFESPRGLMNGGV